MRERFPRHPLRIFCPHDNQNHTDLSDIVAQNRMRIAGLWIDADTDAGILSALDAFQGCAPELHTLYIQLSAWISPAKTAAIEARLAELSAPLIQYLRVDSAATRCLWNSQIIRASNLRHLSICGFEEVPDSESDDSGSAQSEDKPDLREVLDVLVHLESLEVLCLVYCSPPTHQLFVAERRPCPRSLQELVVWGSACDSINILQNLELTQPLGRVVLCNTVCGDCVDFTLALLQLVEKRCVLPRDVTLEAEQPEEEKWNIELALEFGRSPSTPTSVGWSFPVGISFQTEDEAEAPLVLQDIIQMLRTSRITSLALKGQLNSPNAFRNSRGELPGNWPSQEISVGCSWAFISLMKSFLRATSILSRYSAVLPNVTSLEFADIDFLMRPRSRTGQPWFEVLRSGVEWLWRRRSEDGRPILRRVMFRRCTGFSEEDLEVLRSMVPGVHVLTMNDLTPPVTIPPGNDSE
ncbi:hypothetical protein PUNSTDRAFT_130583 [Punctularia strigosozonata HHB-11173 SS5]|uniref:uncharacterized protein n=1 Tax=Punctularia strigosozonata (strain HHB-11173) TaxID=741275 RepID=UPI000441795A|nr:uncharacterized protein PUNSTDRAFT_130583 [Punctularia strigosozonata HHB-11173 SS5]EIN12326.1 hypothetical protein PUNSTDRAFT_130583 [Punctularia strigosozonata HHB-11173 SS5]